MTKNQAETLVERLKNACNFHRFDEPGVYVEYVRALARFDYDRMEQAIDEIIEEDSRNVPPISVLVKKYKGVAGTKGGRMEVKNEQYCDVCDDKGYVLMKEQSLKTKNLYEYVLYCPFCNIGRAQAYDGRNINDKEHRSPYYVPPITEYFGDEGIAALRATNLKKRKQDAAASKPVEKAVQSVGKSIPDGWKYEMEEVPF